MIFQKFQVRCCQPAFRCKREENCDIADRHPSQYYSVD